MINPQDKTLLQKYTLVAKKIIYEPARMKTFMKMLGSKEGALTAVNTVIAAIDKLKPVPAPIAPLLGVNVYILMVDIAQEVTGLKPDPAVVQEVIGIIMSEVGGQQAPAPAEAPGEAPGMLAQMQGGQAPAEPAPEQDPGMLAQMQRRGVPA